MHKIKLIALDLDGTLLNSSKGLSQENAAALAKAAAMGVEIVPTTGRFFGGMPEVVRSLPFLHYAITINGAQVYDIQKEKTVAQAEIPLGQAVKIMEYLDTLPVIYDCYMDNWGWMTKELQNKAAEFAPDSHYLKMLLELRTPVEELKAFLKKRKKDVQKIQLFTKDLELREDLLYTLERKFPDIAVSSSVINNVEINNVHANKGAALERLAEYLGIDAAQTIAFGDGLNDLSMIKRAGIGIAMENAHPDVKAAADYVTFNCDENGVAEGIKEVCFS